MASLKHNGKELARLVFDRTDSNGVVTTHRLSFGERGHILRRIDVADYVRGTRVKGDWKRFQRIEGDVDEEVEAWRNAYRSAGWRELQPYGLWRQDRAGQDRR